MQRWMAIEAGGTSQRLKPGLAMMDSLRRNLGIGMESGEEGFN
jgi:hypothetical protein